MQQQFQLLQRQMEAALKQQQGSSQPQPQSSQQQSPPDLAMGFPDAKSAIQAWADEETQYIYGELTPSNFEEVGHFTQVCRYAPPGNVVDNFVKNVAPARRST
ncbi:hypothetical protein QJQ45_017528 [Haematococcus lacustris]|nr:hypothetical protein QJQ45_017528 [Haematococcus lacustris]